MGYKHAIIYKPVCGNCGAVIHGEVSVDSGRLGHIYWSQVIQPCVCENCGEAFETIIMPRPNDSNWSIDMDIDYTNVRGGQYEWCKRTSGRSINSRNRNRSSVMVGSAVDRIQKVNPGQGEYQIT